MAWRQRGETCKAPVTSWGGTLEGAGGRGSAPHKAQKTRHLARSFLHPLLPHLDKEGFASLFLLCLAEHHESSVVLPRLLYLQLGAVIDKYGLEALPGIPS
jgi:hypothetical protein